MLELSRTAIGPLTGRRKISRASDSRAGNEDVPRFMDGTGRDGTYWRGGQTSRCPGLIIAN
jgi:hypothetical protein